MEIVELPGTVNFNTLTQYGFYINNSVITSTYTNSPDSAVKLFFVLVLSDDSKTYVTQLYFANDATNKNIYFRILLTGVWTSWQRLNYVEATTTTSGLMSAADKTKLDNSVAPTPITGTGVGQWVAHNGTLPAGAGTSWAYVALDVGNATTPCAVGVGNGGASVGKPGFCWRMA